MLKHSEKEYSHQLKPNRNRRRKVHPTAVTVMANPMRSSAITLEFPGVNKAVVDEVMSKANLWGYIPPHRLPYLLQHMKGVARANWSQ